MKPRTLPFLLIALLVASACGDATVSDRTHRAAPTDSLQALAFASADSMVAVMDIPALVRQVLMVPASPDTSAPDRMDSLATLGYAGLLLPFGEMSAPPIPALPPAHAPFRAVNLDTAWAATIGMPTLIRIGAAHSDTLASAYGATIGQSLAAMGADMAILSVARLLRSGHREDDVLGADLPQVHQQSAAIIAGLARAGIRTVARPLPATAPQHDGGPGHYGKGMRQLHEDLLPFTLLSSSHAILGQTAFLHAPRIDTALAPYSIKLTRMLRAKAEQPVFSPVLGGRDSNATAVAALRCLQAGQDIIVLRTHAAHVEASLGAWAKDGSLPADSLRDKARRIIAWKLLHPAPKPGTGSAIPTSPALAALAQWATEASLTVVRDNRRILPLKGGLAANPISLAGSSAASRPFAEALSVYVPATNTPLDTTAPTAKALLEQARDRRLIIVPLLPGSPFMDLAGGLRPAIARVLAPIDSLGRLIIVNFGPPSQLKGLEPFGAVIQAWSDDDPTQRAAAQLILGAMPASGRIPLQCGPLFCIGDGVQRGSRGRLGYTIPEAVGANRNLLARIDQIVNAAIDLGAFPGCQVLAAKGGQVFYHKAFGHHDYSRRDPVSLDDLYDIASVTKVAATTLMAMHAYERDTLHLEEPLKHYLPELDSSFITIKDITPRLLLLHQAGLPPGLPIYKYCVANDSAEEVRKRYYAAAPDSSHDVFVTPSLYFNSAYLDSLWLRVRCTPLDTQGQYLYSDMSMFLMQRVLERITATPLNRYVDSVFYRPMGLRTMCYLPHSRFDLDRIAPTENDRWWRNQEVHGAVHDPSTAMFGGVGGQAGLFSNAWDLAAIMYMLLNDGQYAGNQFLQAQTIRFFSSRQPGSHRGLGFDMQRSSPMPGEGMVAHSANPSTFGHLGFTGTCAWADPSNDVIFIFLSNRVHPSSDNKRINEYRVRQAVQQAVYEALGLGPVAMQEEPCP